MFVRVKTPKRILIIRPDVVGDVVLTTPVISALKTQYPDSEIYLLQQAYTCPLTEEHPHIKDVICDWRHTEKAKGVFGFLNYATFIRSFHFDMVIHVYFTLYYAVLCWHAGIPIRVGDSNKLLLRLWLTHPQSQPVRNLSLHEVEQNLALLKPFLSPDLRSPALSLPKRESDFEAVYHILISEKILSSPYILIHPSTGRGNRAWHPELYAELITLIYQKTQYLVVVTGHGQRDAELVMKIRKNTFSPFISMVNKTTLPELMGLVRLAAVVVGTDTGPTHIAAAFQIPVLGISPTKYVKSLRWGPWQTQHQVVGRPYVCDVVCQPHTCKLTTCLDAISTQDVFSALLALLQQTKHPARTQWIQQSIRVMVLETDTDIISLLQASSIPYFVFIGSLFNLFELRRFITSHDCAIVHTSTPIPMWYQRLIRMVCAPLMSVPPIFIHTKPESSQDIGNFYMLHFSKWYPN